MKLEKIYLSIFNYLSTRYGKKYFTTRKIAHMDGFSVQYSLNIIKGDKFDNSSVIPIINIFKLCGINIFELTNHTTHSTKSYFTYIIIFMYGQKEESNT